MTLPATVGSATLAAAREAAIALLQQLLGDRLSTAASIREGHGKDASYHPCAPPDAVAFASGTSSVRHGTMRENVLSLSGMPSTTMYYLYCFAMLPGVPELSRRCAAILAAAFQPYGGFPDGVAVEGGYITMPELAGIGFEGKSDLSREMKALTN